MFAEKPDIYRSNLSCRDRLGFYAEIQIIFGTVLQLLFVKLTRKSKKIIINVSFNKIVHQ